MKKFQPAAQRDRPRRLGRGITIPAAEAPDDPGGPGQAAWVVRVLLQRRLALDLVVESVEDGDLRLAEGDLGRLAALAVARLHQLKGYGRRLGGDGGELDEAFGAGKLAVLELQTLSFHEAEQLLDRPAQPVPVDDLPSRRRVIHRMGGEQAPVHRLDARGFDEP